MMSRLAASSVQFLRSLLRVLIPLPLILALAQFSCGATYNKEAFLPAECCYCADISPAGNVIYAAGQFGDWDAGVRLYDASTYEHIKDVHSFPKVPKYILASADGIHLYTTAYYQGTVAKVRVSDGAVVKSISVGPWPVGMVFDSVRRYVYVMVNCPYPGAVGSISIIDTSTDTVVGTIGPIVHAGTVLAISPDDQFLYALSFDYAGSEPQTLYKMTIADRSVQAVPGVRVGGISVSPDGQLLYVGDRFAGSVRVFQTSSMTETTPIPIPDVHSFWVAPSGDHGLAVCYAPGSDHLLVHVVQLPSGHIPSPPMSHTLEMPDGLSSWPLVDPIFWNRTTGEALIPIFRVHGGVIVVSPAEEPGQTVYESDFSTDPGWITDQAANYYWNQTAGTYHAKVENNAPAYSPNRYFYKPVTWTGDSFEIQWDIKMTRADWSAGVSFGLFDENIAFAGFGGGQGVCLEFANPDAGRLIWLYICGAGGLASASSPGGTYAVNTLYTCKILYDSSIGEVSVELVVHDTGAPVWSKSLAVPGGFTVPLVKLGGSRSGFGETGYGGVDRWGVSEAEIDNVMFKRAGVVPLAPVVTQFAINGGAATTESRLVTLNNAATNSPTHYMASESSAFTGATWQTYSGATQFILTAGDGQKTVYFKTKNAAGESNVVTDSITLQQAAAVYKVSAFLPACACYSVDVSPDDSIIYARSHLGDWDEGVKLYDARTYSHIKDFHSLPGDAKYILASADGNYLYATSYYGSSVVKLSASTAELVKSIPVGPWPVGMVFDSARRYLYVMVNGPYSGAEGWISIVDTSTDEIQGTIGPISNAGDVLAISPDDKFLYAIGSGAQTLYKMSTAERSVVSTVTGVQTGGISVSPDGQILYVANPSAGAVRVFQTSSMAEVTPIPVADVNGFWVAPSGGHGLAVCLAPGSGELLIRVIALPNGEILQTLSQTLELPDGLSSYPLVDPVFWNRTTGEALIPIFREYGGVIVISPAGETGRVVYETDFSSDPGWVTDQAANYYWNQAAGTYHAKVENNAPGYRPNRYFYKAVTWTGDSLEVEWDVEITRMDWSGGVCFGLFDEDLALGGFEGGQGVQVVFGHPDEGLVLAFYATGASGLAQADSKAGPRYSTSVWYTCKVSLNAAAGEVSVEVKDRSSGSSVWSKSLSVPGRFSRPLVRLGGSWSGFGETAGGYAGVNRWAVAEAEIDNVVFKRAGVAPLAPVVTQFSINSGAATTQSRTVTLNNTTENGPTHYMASENAIFSGVSWQTYSTAPQFTLSSGDGQKTVYFKTKNELGESNVVSDAIQLITSVPPGPEITTTSLPNGVEGHLYDQALQVSGGVSPYTWRIVAGKLPDGLNLDPNTGIISGTPTNAAVGTSTFTVRVTASQSTGDIIYVFGGLHEDLGNLSSVEKYDPVADAWTFVSPMNEPRYNMGFCTDDQARLYAIAGQSENVLGTVERYDPATDVWEYLAPLPIAVGGPAAFTLNGEVYGVGGWMPGYTNRCFIYSPGTDTWREGPSVYETFGHAGPVVGLSGVPYLIGGHLDHPWSIRSAVSMLVREGADLVWKPSTPLQRRRQGVGVTLGLDGLIYAIGGDQEPGSSGHLTTETVERFSEATKAWEYVQPMPGKRAFAGAVTDSSGRIWAVGGTDWTLPFFDSVLCYDPGTDSWTTMTSRLNTGRIGHGIAITHGTGQTDDQELSITIFPQGPWQVVYSTDFSSDPGWTTNSAQNLYWNQTDGNYHFKLWQKAEQYAYKSISYDPAASYRLEFDVEMTRCDWAGFLRLGLGDADMNMNFPATWYVQYHRVDQGQTGSLCSLDSQGGRYAPGGLQPAPFQLNVWYHNVATYDPTAGTLSLKVTKVSDGSPVGEVSLTGVGTFSGIDRLYMSTLYETYAPGATAEGYIDNLVLKSTTAVPQPPVVTQFAINSGAGTTENRTVTLNNTVQNNPTHYMASESSGLTGATWETYSSAPQFTLSAGEGQKTVYFKTKNEAGESNVVSDTIQLLSSVPQGPEITTTALPNGVEGRPYNEVLQVSGGVPPYTWSITSGSLPDGLSLDPNTGVISGTPTDAAIGTSTFTVRVTDSQSTGDAIYVFGGQRDYSVVLSSVEKYDPAADVWTFVSPMNEPRVSTGFCTDDQGRFYAIAGQNAGELRTVERYDPARDVWQYLGPLPIAVAGPAAFTLNGEVYAVGGWMPGYTNRCFIYSPDTGTWREGPSVYETFGHAGPVISLSGVPYLIGGHLDTPSWSIRSAVSMLVREGADLVWKPSTPLQRRRQGVGVTLGLDGLIYAIGGDEKPGSSGHVTTETVERFSEATKAWEYVQPMPGKRAFAGAVTDSSGRIWAVGGTDWTLPFFDSVLRYDPGTDSWTTMTSRLNTGRIGHGIAITRGQQQTDEQQLSITVLPKGPWRVVYSSDFSTDPKWTTEDPANLSWDSATETFHGWQSNADGTYAYTPIEPTIGSSFRLEFDVRINFIEWSAGLTFGLFDSRLMYNAGAVIEYGYFDVGHTIALYSGNPSGPPDWNVTNWETGVWYRNLIAYDAESKVIMLEVRRRDDDALICQLSLSGISSFPPGMGFLGTSRLHMAGYNHAAVDFNLDNVVLEEFYQPPKREVEIVPLAGPMLRISWDSEVGKEYQLWATSDLSSGEWVPVGPRMGGTGEKLYVDDYVEGPGNRFYRVEIISPVAEGPDYAVVVSESTAAVDGWDDVVNALVSRHAAPVIPYSGAPFPAAVRDELAAFHPRYVCFVAQPTEVTDAFVINVHELTRQLDDDPFGDCLWGIITGARPEDAMRLASASSPLEIQRGLLKAGGFLEWLPAGVFHSESDNATMWVKELGGEIEKRTDGPLDDTESLVTGLNSGDYQLFVTSGHASEYNWQLHWPDPDGEGFFFSDNGQLYAIDHNSTRHDINVPQPIIHWAPGNCLIGRMAGADSMALGWLGSGRAVQFCGYIVPTWYGYMGWGLNDYFLKLQDRFSFAEAFFLTNQALIFDQLHGTPGADPEGLAYDKNAVVFYGNPAFRAVVSRCRAPLYEQSIEATPMPRNGEFRVVLTITMNEDAEVPRPVIAFLPFRVVPSETILEQSEAQGVEITDDMVLAQIWVQGEPALPAAGEVRVTFTCVRAS